MLIVTIFCLASGVTLSEYLMGTECQTRQIGNGRIYFSDLFELSQRFIYKFEEQFSFFLSTLVYSVLANLQNKSVITIAKINISNCIDFLMTY